MLDLVAILIIFKEIIATLVSKRDIDARIPYFDVIRSDSFTGCSFIRWIPETHLADFFPPKDSVDKSLTLKRSISPMT